MLLIVSYVLIVLLILFIAVKMSSKDVIGYMIFFWVALLVFGIFSQYKLVMLGGALLYTLTAVVTCFIVRALVSKGFYRPVVLISGELKEYIIRVSIIVSFLLFWTVILLQEGLTINSLLTFATYVLFIGILYRVLKAIAQGLINTIVNIVTGLMPPSAGVEKYKNNISPVEARTFRTKKKGKDITHVLIRIDNDAKR